MDNGYKTPKYLLIINHTAIKSKNTAIKLSQRMLVIFPMIKSKIPKIAVMTIGVVKIKLSSFYDVGQNEAKLPFKATVFK